MRSMMQALLAALVLVVHAGPANAGPAWSAQPIVWAQCPDNPEGECGTLEVPLDHRKPNGPRIDLAVARHRATPLWHPGLSAERTQLVWSDGDIRAHTSRQIDTIRTDRAPIFVLVCMESIRYDA